LQKLSVGIGGHRLQIWERFFARQTPDDLIHKIERSKFVIANLAAAGAPTVGSLRFADPIGLITSHGVATITDLIPGRIAIRRKPIGRTTLEEIAEEISQVTDAVADRWGAGA
jgi:hypothetical protein